MTQHIEEARKLDPEWRYEIQYGPEGEANYAWIYKGDLFVATMRTHHAVEIVKAIAALAAAEDRGRSEERERCSAAVPITTGMRELRVSLIARAVRQSLRNYGHKVAESTLPECVAADVERTLVADEKAWEATPAKPPRDCGINGGDLLESRDNIGSAYTRSTTPPAITKEPTP